MQPNFDRITFEQDIKDMVNERVLYQTADALAKLREKRQITAYEYEECSELIKERFRAIKAARQSVGN